MSQPQIDEVKIEQAKEVTKKVARSLIPFADIVLLNKEQEKSKEGFALDTTKPKLNIMSVLIGLFAAMQSWRCNSDKAMPERALRALFAYFFGLLYLIFFYVNGKYKCATPIKN